MLAASSSSLNVARQDSLAITARGGYPESDWDESDNSSSMTFTRITVRPEQMGGVPCIRSLRIPVATVVGMIADGMTEAEILAAFPDLEPADVREALRYAAEALRERELPLVSAR